jgi:hypothetical protein
MISEVYIKISVTNYKNFMQNLNNIYASQHCPLKFKKHFRQQQPLKKLKLLVNSAHRELMMLFIDQHFRSAMLSGPNMFITNENSSFSTKFLLHHTRFNSPKITHPDNIKKHKGTVKMKAREQK